MPQWAVNLLISLAIKALEYFQHRLSSEHCDRIACVLPAKPLPVDENPPLSKQNNPNSQFMP